MAAVALLRDLGVEPGHAARGSHKLPPLHRVRGTEPALRATPATYGTGGRCRVFAGYARRGGRGSHRGGHGAEGPRAGAHPGGPLSRACTSRAASARSANCPIRRNLPPATSARGLSHLARHRGRAREPHRWAGRHREARGRGRRGRRASASVFPGAVGPAGGGARCCPRCCGRRHPRRSSGALRQAI